MKIMNTEINYMLSASMELLIGIMIVATHNSRISRDVGINYL